METESAAASEDLRHHHRHSQQNHSRHSSGGENNNVNNNNNNNNNNSHPVEPDLSSEDGEFGSADEIGSEEASAWIARASRSLCEDSQGAPAGIDLDGGAMGVGVVAGDGGGGGVGVGGGGAGSSPPLQGEVNVTLWQFLLELLMSRQYSHVIQWTNREGEFQLLRAEEVARLWGMRKNKNHRMNYDKLSRALRYYYQKNIIKKVQGQKFVYRFVGLSDSVLRAPRSMGSAAAAAAAAAAAIATPPDGVSPKLEAVEDDLPASPHMEEPATIQAPLLFQPTQQQQQQQKSQSLTPPPQPSALTNARRLWQGGQQLHQQHHHIQHHQQLQQHQGLDLSLPHAAAAAAALIASSAASPPPPPPPLAPSKRLRTPESASATRSPESPPAKRPCCACRCHESQAESTATTAAAMAAVSTPRIKTEPTAAAAPAEAEDPADSGSLPSSYIQWLTLELAGGAGGIGGGGGGSGGGGPSFLHSSRHAANMKKLAEHIRLQKIFKRPPPPPPAPEPVAAVSTAATSSPSSMSHGLSHAHPHPAVSQPPPHPGPGLASSFGQSNGSPFSPPGCVWMPVPVAMLSQLWAGHEAAAAAVAAASAAAAAAAVAAAPSSCSSTSGGGGGCSGDAEDHGD